MEITYNLFLNLRLWRLRTVHTYPSLITFFPFSLWLDVRKCVLTQVFTLLCANIWPLIFFHLFCRTSHKEIVTNWKVWFKVIILQILLRAEEEFDNPE